jgi:hypothetical protein
MLIERRWERRMKGNVPDLIVVLLLVSISVFFEVIGLLMVYVRYFVFFTRHCHVTVMRRRTIRYRQANRAWQRYSLTRSAGKRRRLDLAVPLPPRGMPVEVGGRGVVAPRIMSIMATLHAWQLDVFVGVFVRIQDNIVTWLSVARSLLYDWKSSDALEQRR